MAAGAKLVMFDVGSAAAALDGGGLDIPTNRGSFVYDVNYLAGECVAESVAMAAGAKLVMFDVGSAAAALDGGGLGIPTNRGSFVYDVNYLAGECVAKSVAESVAMAPGAKLVMFDVGSAAAALDGGGLDIPTNRGSFVYDVNYLAGECVAESVAEKCRLGTCAKLVMFDVGSAAAALDGGGLDIHTNRGSFMYDVDYQAGECVAESVA
eukprot:gene23409-30683_t